MLPFGGAAGLTLSSAAQAGPSIQLQVEDQLPPSCAVSVQQAFPAANFTANGSVTATAKVDCNAGFVIRASSQKGALKTANVAGPGFTNTLDYALSVSVPLESSATIGATCAAATLQAGQAGCTLSPAGSGLSSAGVAALSKTATLTATWTLPTPKLVAGGYSDTITISVAAQP